METEYGLGAQAAELKAAADKEYAEFKYDTLITLPEPVIPDKWKAK